MNLVKQAQDLTDYIKALEFENYRLRNIVFRALEEQDIRVNKIVYEAPDSLDFNFDISREDEFVIISKLDCKKIGIKSPQDMISQLKSKICKN